MDDNEKKPPKLKHGIIKEILISAFKDTMPDFVFSDYRNSCYTFLKCTEVRDIILYEIVRINFSLKHLNFCCSVASTLNPKHLYSNQYHTGLISFHHDLKVLKYNSAILNIKNAYYFHDGTLKCIIDVVSEIFYDIKKVGIPYLRETSEVIQTNEIVKVGLEYINKLDITDSKLKLEINAELTRNPIISSIKHPIFLDLKNSLENLSGQSREDRKRISKTAYELLELYCCKGE